MYKKEDLVWIEERCYRVSDPITEITSFQEHDLYENDTVYNQRNDDEDDDDDFEVTTIDETRYSTHVHVSKHLMGYVIGKKGITKSRIERDTKTEIKIQRHGQAEDIVIFGPSVSNLKAARRSINMIVLSSRLKQPPTHFLSIPMNSPDIIKNFEIFKENVLRDCTERGLEESIFIKSSKLHITMGVMCLIDNESRIFASKLLEEAVEKIRPLLQNHQPLRIRLKGLSYMNDDPKNIDVLYGRVQEDGAEGILQSIADTLIGHFVKAGYMKHEFGRTTVKLHVTLINSRYRNQSSSTNIDTQSGSWRKRRESFDGSGVLSKFADYDFGVIELSEIHLSQRHTMGDDGYYLPTHIVSCKT